MLPCELLDYSIQPYYIIYGRQNSVRLIMDHHASVYWSFAIRLLIPGWRSSYIKLQENHSYVKDNRAWVFFDYFFAVDSYPKKDQDKSKIGKGKGHSELMDDRREVEGRLGKVKGIGRKEIIGRNGEVGRKETGKRGNGEAEKLAIGME
jgi:hypothetical protein